jgi:hypothetical protein
MLSRLFPRQFDNVYRGHFLGLWIFVPIMLIKALQSLESIFNTRATAIGADGIPLASFPPAAAEEIVSTFALLGLYLLVIPFQSAIILIRYRSMVPFMYFCLLTLQISTRIFHFLTDASAPQSGHPIGFYINLGIMAVTAIGFFLSLLRGKNAPA